MDKYSVVGKPQPKGPEFSSVHQTSRVPRFVQTFSHLTTCLSAMMLMGHMIWLPGLRSPAQDHRGHRNRPDLWPRTSTAA